MLDITECPDCGGTEFFIHEHTTRGAEIINGELVEIGPVQSDHKDITCECGWVEIIECD